MCSICGVFVCGRRESFEKNLAWLDRVRPCASDKKNLYWVFFFSFSVSMSSLSADSISFSVRVFHICSKDYLESVDFKVKAYILTDYQEDNTNSSLIHY